MSKIYLASSWRNEHQPDAVAFLRSAGHEVYDFRNPPGGIPDGFRWSELDPNWQQWSAAHYRDALKKPLAQRGFNSDFDGMKWADVGVLLLPCGRSAHLEIGWMAGAGKRTIIWTQDGEEPELMALLASEICITGAEVLEALDRSAPSKACSEIPIVPEREAACQEPWHIDDGVPYCDTCGLFRDSVARRLPR